jgi:glycosyltransferase involved in cell wall biosynthesis
LKKVLVIIPTRDRPNLTLEAVRSVTNQTYTDWECLVIDDGSSIENYKLLTKQLKPIPKVKLSRNSTPKGPAACRNFALNITNYDYISFLDSDDLWMVEKLEKQVRALEQENKQWIHCNEIWIRNNKTVSQKKIHRKQGGLFWKRSLSRCLISPSAVLFKGTFFHELGGFQESFPVAEDYELWLRALEKKSIGYLSEPLVLKRAGDWQQLSSVQEIDRYRVLALHRAIRRIKTCKEKRYLVRLNELTKEGLKKTEVLVTGAKKHKSPKLKKYQSWMYLFNKLRT